jgi:hypothetical protein
MSELKLRPPKRLSRKFPTCHSVDPSENVILRPVLGRRIRFAFEGYSRFLVAFRLLGMTGWWGWDVEEKARWGSSECCVPENFSISHEGNCRGRARGQEVEPSGPTENATPTEPLRQFSVIRRA